MNKMTRLTALLLALMMIFSTFAAADTAYQLGGMTQEQWQDIVENAEKELFKIDEGDSGKVVTPESPEQPVGDYYPYTDGTTIPLAIGDEAFARQMTASGVAVLTNGAAGQWQINIGGAWINIAGETGNALWVTSAMMNGMTAADFRKALEPVDDKTGAYTIFTQTATVEIVKELPSTFSLLSRADENGSEAETPADDTTSDGQLSLQAANPDLDKYIIVIDYAFDTTSTSGGTNAATQYMAEVSTNKQSFSATVKHPVVQGYAPTRYTVSAVNADGSTSTQLPEKFTYSDTNIVIADAKIQGDVTITVYYGPAENKFAVKYWEELVEYTIDSAGNDVKYDEVTVNEVPAATLPREYTGKTEAMVKTAYPADYPSYPDKTKVQYFASLYTPEGFKPLLYDEEIAIAADGTTEVNVYYQRLYYLMAFNLNGGQGVNPIYTKHGAEIKELGTPAKPGYAFAGWATEENGAVVYQTSAALLQAIGGKMPTTNSMYYAVWTRAETTYKVAYWFENADSTDSTNTENYSAVYVLDNQKAITESTVDSGSDTIKEITAFNLSVGPDEDDDLSEDPKHFKRNNALDDEYVIAGDGTTVVNVYYTRNEYTIRFIYARRETTGNRRYTVVTSSTTDRIFAEYVSANAWGNLTNTAPTVNEKYEDGLGSFTENGYQYLYYDITAKYNADIANLWPNHLMFDYGNAGSYNGIVQNSWFIHREVPYYRTAGGTKTFKGTYSRMDDDMIAVDYDDPYIDKYEGTKDVVNYFMAFWRTQSNFYHYHIYFKVVPGETLPEDAVTYTHTDGSLYVWQKTDVATSGSTLGVNGQNPPAVPGAQACHARNNNPYNWNDRANGAEDNPYHIFFLYEREEYSLFYMTNGGKELPESDAQKRIPYGASVKGFELTKENMEAYAPDTYYDFGGWYTTQACIPGTEFNFDSTMPSNNVLLYAKWAPHTYSVRVYNTQALADQARAIYAGGGMPEDSVTHLYHWLKEENRGVSHGKPVSSVFDYTDGDQYDPSTKDFPKPTRPNHEFMLWYYYAPDGTMQPFSFPATPITQDTFVFAVWTADALADYTIYYVKSDGKDGAVAESYYTNKDNWVTDSYAGRGLPGANVTERAKGGDQLYDAYRDKGWFPTLESHSFMLELPEEGKKNVYVFEYVQADNMPYVVHYVTEQNNGLDTIEIGGKTYYLVAASKNVTENKKAVVTENYEPVSGNYVPDAFQKRLIITAGMAEDKRVIVFYYEKDASRTTLTVNHWLINADGTTVTPAYESAKRIVDLDPSFSETLNALAIPNYTFDAKLNKLTGTGATLNGMNLTISQGAEGIVVDLYYVEDTVNINYVPVGPEGLDANKVPLATAAGSVDPSQNANIGVVTGNPAGSTAMVNDNYTFDGWYSDPECTAIVTRDAKINPLKNNGVYESATYYAKFEENEVAIQYVAVGPQGASNFGAVDPTGETVKVLTGEANGSTATAGTDYTFVGWYADEACTTSVGEATKYVPTKVNGKYVAATYYAKFVENEVTINYVAVGTEGGSVNPVSETVKVLTDTAQGSTATANANYSFVGWYSDSACTRLVGENAKYVPAQFEGKNIAATYYAKFVENEVTINYVAVGPDKQPLTADEKTKIGYVTPESESVKIINGAAKGSTATLLGGPTYKFAGWYSDENCANLVSSDVQFVPTKAANDLWVDGTPYYAKFDWNVGDLTISKAIDDNKGFNLSDVDFTFKVTLSDKSVNATYDTVVFTNGVATVTLKAGKSITIPGLVHGVGYTVEEINLQPGFAQISPANSAAATGTIQAGSAATAAFINTYSTSKLTISKDGMSSSETALFEVTVVMKDGTKTLQVMVPSGKSVTITGLRIGSDYTVKELDLWTWRYTTADSKTGTISETGSTAAFTNTQKHPYWLDGSDYELNQFGTK